MAKKAAPNNLLNRIKKTGNNLKIKFTNWAKKSPTRAFYTLLGALVLFIALGNFLRTPTTKTTVETEKPAMVSIYSIGEAPKLKVQAKMEKSGVIKIVAISGGIVNQIYKTEGQTVYAGENIAYLASNYNGASAQTTSRQLAQANYNFVKDTYDAQKEIIGKNRDIINKGADQADKLRDITIKSIDETKGIISNNDRALGILDQQLAALDAMNVNGSSNSAILSLLGTKASLAAATNQAKQGLRNLEYQTNTDNEPSKIADIQQEVALKQLEIQEKSLELNKEVSSLNLRLAQIQESLAYPSAPCAGVVERIYVQNGQFVAPGTPIASIKSNNTSLKAVALVAKNIAEKVSSLEPSLLSVNGETVEITPTYVSTEPTDGGLYSVVYYLDESLNNKIGNQEYLALEMPVGMSDAFSSVPYLPLDAVYQTNEEAYVYLAQKTKKGYVVKSQSVELNEVFGDYVEVASGLHKADKVILDRSVIEGERIEFSL